MGGCVSAVGKSPVMELAMVGLDGSGKTTILYYLKKKDIFNVNRTVGYNLERIRVKNMRFNLWDIGGFKNIRPLWKYHFTGKHGVIFVIDCAEPNRLEDALSSLRNVVKEPGVRRLKVLIFANKQDMPGAVKAEVIEETLMKDSELKNIEWKIMSVSAIAGHGLKTGLLWFKSQRRTTTYN